MSHKHINCLEITSSTVKLLGVSKNKKNLLQVDFFDRREFSSRPEIEDAIQKFVSSRLKASDFVTTSVWSPTMYTRKISMPIFTPSELKGAIQLEADKYIPFAVEDCVLDHQVIRQDNATKKMDVLLVAAKKEPIVERCRFLEKMGLRVSFMDVHPAAVCNLYLAHQPEYRGEATAVIHIGDVPGRIHGEENFVGIIKNGVPVVMRDLGNKLSSAEVAEEVWVQIASQIMHAAVFYENAMQEKVQEFVISGDAETCRRIVEALERDTQKKVQRWSILDQLDYANSEVKKTIEEYESSAMVCLGLALRKLAK